MAVRTIALATFVGLALRLTFALGYWVDKPLTHDEQEYLALAGSIARGEGFRYPPPESPEVEVERFGRAPAYPFFLSLVGGSAVRDGQLAAVPSLVKTAQSIVGATAIPILAAIAWRMAGPRAAIVAAIIAAVHPPLVWISAYALSEVLYVPLAWLAALFIDLAAAPRSPIAIVRSPLSALLAGAIGGVAALTRPAMVAFIGLAAIWFARHRWTRLAAMVLLGSVLVIGPWTIRNVREYGRFVLIASEGGITFWTGNHPLAIGEGDMAANPAIKQSNRELRSRHPVLSPEALEPIYYREAAAYIASHPGDWLALLVRKAFYLIVPVGPSYRLHSMLYQAGSLIPYLMLLPLAVLAPMRMPRSGNAGVWLMLLSSILVSLAFFPQERFRIPSIDPALIILASIWIALRLERVPPAR